MNKRHKIVDYILTLLSVSKSDKKTPQPDLNLSLNQTATEFREFLDEIPGGFFIYHAGGNEDVIYANKALLHIFGCSDFEEFRELTGGTFRGLVHPDDLDAVEKSIARQINGHNDIDYVQYRIIRKDNSVRWIEDYGHFINDETLGDMFYVFVTDVTIKRERELYEKATLVSKTEEKERVIKSLIETHGRELDIMQREQLRGQEVIHALSIDYESILYIDLEADSILPYRLSKRLTPKFDQEWHARGYNEYVNDYVKTIVHPDDRQAVQDVITPERMRKKLSECKTYYLNFRGYLGKEMQYLQLRVVRVGGSKNPTQAVLGYRNIGEEVRQEQERTQVLKDALTAAKQAEEAKNTFLSNMSHDTRTPLNAIFGYTTLAKSVCEDDAVRTYLDKIDVAAKQILEQVERVLEVSDIESNGNTVHEIPCNIVDFLDELRSLVVPAAKAKRITVTFDANVTHPNVYADTVKLKRSLGHMLNNAVKYTDRNGHIAVRCSEQSEQSRGYSVYKFDIEDNGVGIDRAMLDHIFEPFARERNTTDSGVFGTGLGLTIAKSIIDTMGGKIEVESEPGKGSCFTVTLALRRQKTKEESSVDTKKIISAIKDSKILVVDDNEINLDIITEILQDDGFTVDIAENGSAAVDKIAASKPGEYAFVIMDIQMPVMDGREATQKIRALDNRELASIPIIALSANAFESDKRMSIEAGMNAHLPKPMDLNLLFDTVVKTIKS